MTSIAIKRVLRQTIPAIILAVGSVALYSSTVQAQDTGKEALQILKSMSDYLGGQKGLEIAYDTDIEVITPELQKIQFASSSKLQLSRPNKLHVTRTGGYADVELFADGSMFTVFDRAKKMYVQADDPGTVDQLVDKMREEYGVNAPGADLLSQDVYKVLSADVVEADHIGQGVINGVTCEHLAFRNFDTDWQIWVESGANPIPRKFVITSKSVTGAPQYTLLVTDWKTNADPSPDAFAFKGAADAKKVDFKSLVNIDEVPIGFIKGEKQ
jgi:hypothetical protein